MSWVDDAIDDMYERREREALTTAPMPDDTEQIDDQVQDLLHTNLMTRIDRYTGLDEESVAALAAEIEVHFRKDLASLGIRLTYDTPIGGE